MNFWASGSRFFTGRCALLAVRRLRYTAYPAELTQFSTAGGVKKRAILAQRRPKTMTERRLRVLTIASHPVQYGAPLFRLMARHPKLDFQVAYCSLRGAESGYDPEFGANVQWDVPLLDRYKWTHIPNRGNGTESFWAWRTPTSGTSSATKNSTPSSLTSATRTPPSGFPTSPPAANASLSSSAPTPRASNLATTAS